MLESVYQNLIVAILGSFGETEEKSLGDVILSEEVRSKIQGFIGVWNWVFLWEQFSRQWLEFVTLWWVHQLRYEYALLRLIISKPPKELILVNKCQLCTRWIHMNLMDQHVCHFTVLYHGNPEQY